MRRIVLVGFLVLAAFADGAMAQQQLAQGGINDVPRGETIVWFVQIELSRAGLYEGPHNGSLTDETREAIEDFEHRIGWPETGRATPDLALALRRYNLTVIAEGDDF